MGFYIVYPRGDRSKLVVVELSVHCEYELSDYAVASRQKFHIEKDANDYAKKLAKDNNKLFECDEPDYLD